MAQVDKLKKALSRALDEIDELSNHERVDETNKIRKRNGLELTLTEKDTIEEMNR